MSAGIPSTALEVMATAEVPATALPPRPPPSSEPDSARKGFDVDQSVRAWAALDKDITRMAAGDGNPIGDIVRAILQDVQRDPVRAGSYYSYHLDRSLFFLSALGTLYVRALQTASDASAGALIKASGVPVPVPARELLDLLVSFRHDYSCIVSGQYSMPYDMENMRHRQYNPVKVAADFSRFLPEALASLARLTRKEAEPVWIDHGDDKYEAIHPDYYNTFHYQGDGWLSTKSSEVYEFSTEVLFFGKQDAMQRLTLVPLGRFIRAHPAVRSGRKLDYLELACGTGRFLTFTLDAFGDLLRPTALDLSPFYLERVRENVEHWTHLRGSRWHRQEPVRLIQANAERVPLADASMDAITSVYLFHEVPPPVMRYIAREVGRILRPGGIFVLTDSMQLGDRPKDKEAGFFSTMNEPYYGDYFATDLAAVFQQEAGLEPEWKGMRAVTKTLSFRNPC
jgi:ubiquinone/menaquinone biosynthesis C-methylase UbiE